MCAATEWLRKATWSPACELASGLDAIRRGHDEMMAPLPAPAANMDEAVEPPGAASADVLPLMVCTALRLTCQHLPGHEYSSFLFFLSPC